MSRAIDKLPREGNLLGGALGTPKRVAIVSLLARRAAESPDDRFTQTMITNELIGSGKKLVNSDTSSVFRLLESYNLLERSADPAVFGFGIVEGRAQDNFWRAAQLMIRATEAIVVERP